MTISYNWLCDYLPEKIEPLKLSAILTSIGLEVESLEKFETIKGGLNGLVVGEVVDCTKHPNADKLSVTKVNVGEKDLLQIVCGASNVAVGQKVIVAKTGVTIFPTNGEPVTMRVAKIRGVESFGMICAEDEIGLSEDHAGIKILDVDTKIGSSVAAVFNLYTDWIYEIGLTPNRMDAMSHLGVAKDVCAYLTHHTNKNSKVISPLNKLFKTDNAKTAVTVTIENTGACKRYAGISIKGVEIKISPEWLQNKLKAIGQRPINNIVDITNFVLHETGQPLHAFDEDKILGNEVIVKNVTEGTKFITLDGKERLLTNTDLMICNKQNGMCIAGVFGGLDSGVTEKTKNIFLESAWFNPASIRKTALQHGLRTEASTHFEKGVDISNCVNVLKRAALLIKETAGGEITGNVIDEYPKPEEKKEVILKYHYLKKLSGKNYHPDTVKKILTSLDFEIIKEGIDEIRIAAPFNKPDIALPADIVEEIIRIDGLDNILIPDVITISPAKDELGTKEKLKEKISDYLTGCGYNEIVTNSITNSKYYSEEELNEAVKMINNLSADLDILRPYMHETALESIAYNINRKNSNIKFFEFGKTYAASSAGNYNEQEHFCLYATGFDRINSWNEKEKVQDFFTIKGLASALLTLCSITQASFGELVNTSKTTQHDIKFKNDIIGCIGEINAAHLKIFDIKQPVFFIDFFYDKIVAITEKQKIVYSEIVKFPAVERDVALIIDNKISYKEVEKTIEQLNLKKLKQKYLFDIFESDKLGKDKKSLAIKFVFLDEEKTLTDEEVEKTMQKIIGAFETNLHAVIRK